MSRLIRAVHRRFLTPYRIASMSGSPSPVVRAVGAALTAQRTGALTHDERAWIERIEALRARVEQSTEVVTIPDYGAGSPSDSRSPATSGRVLTQVVGDACRDYSKSRSSATLLFHLVRKLKPVACVEMGACLGISAAYQAAALELNGQGRLITLEGAPSFGEIAQRNLQSLGLHDRASLIIGRFEDTLDAALDNLGRVDCVFIDGHHEERATLQYFENVFPRLSDQAMVVFDDIGWSPGMQNAWQRLAGDPRVDVALDLFTMGICLFGAGARARYTLAVA